MPGIRLYRAWNRSERSHSRFAWAAPRWTAVASCKKSCSAGTTRRRRSRSALFFVALARGQVGGDAESGQSHPGPGGDLGLAPDAPADEPDDQPADQLVDHSSVSSRILWANRLCIVKSSMKPGLACCENSPPDSPKDARERSYSA